MVRTGNTLPVFRMRIESRKCTVLFRRPYYGIGRPSSVPDKERSKKRGFIFSAPSKSVSSSCLVSLTASIKCFVSRVYSFVVLFHSHCQSCKADSDMIVVWIFVYSANAIVTSSLAYSYCYLAVAPNRLARVA
jgi:hypothetical protein